MSEIKIKQTFNGLSTTEWAKLSKNVWGDIKTPSRSIHQKEHGATFPEDLAERAIKIYSKEKDLIFDPFSGTGTTLLSAYRMKRNSLGTELNEKFYTFIQDRIRHEKSNLFDGLYEEPPQIKVVNDDCRNMLKHVEPESVQLTFTSPPYANFIQKSLADRKKTHKKSKLVTENNSTIKQYSEKEEDFGNLSYVDFLNQIKGILKDNFTVTKNGGYSIWVVKDNRNTQEGIPYIDFHSDIARAGKEVGWLYHDLIIWDQNKQRKLILLGYPSVFYTNQNCSFVVVFRKKV